jgi:hypothetical protein
MDITKSSHLFVAEEDCALYFTGDDLTEDAGHSLVGQLGIWLQR